MSLLSARGISKSYGPQTLFDQVSLTIEEGDRVGVLGVNGTGKSTLLRVLAGLEAQDSGTIDRRRGGRFMYLAQEPRLDAEKTPRAIVLEGLAAWSQATARHAEVTRALAASPTPDLLAEQAKLADDVERLGGWEMGHVAREILGKLGIKDEDRPVGPMSGGEKRRVALAQILVARPTLAILDEPTNHLDTGAIEWLEGYLAEGHAGAVLMVTHDRYVLDAVATRIVELSRGVLTEFEGNYAAYLEQKEALLLHEAKVEQNRLNFLRNERAWLQRGAKARTTKQKARIQRAEAAIAEQATAPKPQARIRLEGSAVQRVGKSILDLEDVALEAGGNRLFEGLTLHMTPGERLGVIGPNGAGKTSLLRAITGDLAPARGRVALAKNTRPVLFDQARAQLVDDWSIFDNVAEREGAELTGGGVVEVGDRTVNLRTYLEQFLFDGAKQRQKVGALSGGERARVALAKALKTGANLLLLDEPTNDLDVMTLAALEEMLVAWPGCAIVVSHDRAFLNHVATSILAMSEGKATLYPGNYDTYVSLRPEPEPEAKPAPKPPSAPPPASGPKKLTYAERIEYAGIMDAISVAEARVADVERKLGDPELYASRASEAKALQEDLAAAKRELDRLTARWEELESRI